VKECPSDRKISVFLIQEKEKERKREKEKKMGGEKKRERETARRSINPLAVIATRSRYIREIKFRISSAHISLLSGH